MGNPGVTATGLRRDQSLIRECSACNRDLPIGRFRRGDTVCRDCRAAIERRRRNTPAARRAARDARYRRRYGITLADYERMARAQRWRCAICGQLPARGSRLVPDHDHDTGQVRGLLCSQCNSGIGLLGDSPARLRAAAEYLETHG